MRFVCIRYARTNFEAEDIFQEGFVKVFANLHQYAGTGSVDGWIRRIIVNTAIDYYKKHRHWSEQKALNENELDHMEVADESVEEIAAHLTQEDLLSIIQALPEGYRMVFNLYAIEGFTHAKIGEALGISEGTSKSQLAKARRMLKSLVKGYVRKPEASVIPLTTGNDRSELGISMVVYGR